MPDKNFLGQGLLYPLQQGATDLKSGSDIELIESSIRVILDTPIGSLRWKPTFGSKLHTLVWKNNNEVVRTLAIRYTYEAINKWEPRIVIDEKNIDVTIKETEIMIVIKYRIIDSNIESNLVYTQKRMVA